MSNLFFSPFDSLIRLSDLDTDVASNERSQQPLSRRVAKHHALPKLDLVEGTNNITAILEVPGLTKDKLDISLHDNVLTISGQNEHVKETQSQGSSYRVKERSYESFARSIAVPPGLNENEIQASLENGLLKITLPKRVRDSEAKKITIG